MLLPVKLGPHRMFSFFRPGSAGSVRLRQWIFDSESLEWNACFLVHGAMRGSSKVVGGPCTPY